jgi:hypothetical protein
MQLRNITFYWHISLIFKYRISERSVWDMQLRWPLAVQQKKSGNIFTKRQKMNFAAADNILHFIKALLKVTLRWHDSILPRDRSLVMSPVKYDSAHRTWHFLYTVCDISCGIDRPALAIEALLHILTRWNGGYQAPGSCRRQSAVIFRESALGIANTPSARLFGVRMPVGARDFSLLLTRPDWLWGPFNGYRCSFLGG